MKAGQFFDVIFKSADLNRFLWRNAVKLLIGKSSVNLIASLIIYFWPVDAFFGKNRIVFVLATIKRLDQGTGRLFAISCLTRSDDDDLIESLFLSQISRDRISNSAIQRWLLSWAAVSCHER